KAYRVSLVGACVGALVGGICRAVLAVFHLSAGQDSMPVLIIAADARDHQRRAGRGHRQRLVGATVGAARSVLVFLVNYPLVALFQFLGSLTSPTLLEVVGAGALAGGGATP
ncbi:MAG TPA: hypothetical protein VJA25_13995, partial [Dehalococcoidia bacterium]|nr:hypothetical protein [Dehalococcoidia bacterium]